VKPDRRGHQSGGFTLVELLIVFSIVGLLVALVAPMGAQQMDKARAQEEWLVLDRTIESLAFRAFAEGRAVTLEARGKELVWQLGAEPPRSVALKYLFFDPSQRITIDANGLADHDAIEVRQANRARTLELNRWIAGR
jgi:prepilin-type N-terminal cleavage/methylation domain-containing protein